ncbi:MAG: prolipoprotein diacylglyceryl transferase [Proteobacteria bacterium]|nr:prolipoprotein diacylglyceryl transferase [Pseudomonadota bacterium]
MNHYIHDIDPIAFYIFSDPIAWYWLAYLFGFFFVYFMSVYLIHKDLGFISRRDLNTYMVFCWIGVIVGARLGYVLIYNPLQYLEHPYLIIQLWRGGMSFHGGLIGCLLATLYVSKRCQHSLFYMTDLVCLLIPLPLALGRITNFVNGELAGKATSLPWGVIFPAYDNVPRHPSQLYQACLEGLLLFCLLWLQRRKLQKPGIITSYFLIGYGFLRFLVEFIRLPDQQIGYLLANTFTMGHLLCGVMIIAGILLYITRCNSKQQPNNDPTL